MFLAQVFFEVRMLGKAALAPVLGTDKGLFFGVLIAEVMLQIVAPFKGLLRSRTADPAAMVPALLQLPIHLFLFFDVDFIDVAPQCTERFKHEMTIFPVAEMAPR